jgi:hypothetical protein
MAKACKFVLGLWAGTSAVACVMAWVYTFFATGKIAVPTRQGCELVAVDLAADRLEEWIEINVGGLHD